MTVVKQLNEFVVYPVAMGAGVALCLWVLLEPLGIGRLAAGGQSSTLATPDPPPIPDKQGAAATEDDQFARPSGRIASAMDHLPLKAGDSGPLVVQLQGALIKKGYSVSHADADGGNLDDDTLAALGAFQDDHALPVRPSCDRQCWTALGLSRPE